MYSFLGIAYYLDQSTLVVMFDILKKFKTEMVTKKFKAIIVTILPVPVLMMSEHYGQTDLMVALLVA